ncbi:MAG: MoaD/ThiS family protein [Pirellulales bacterium]|nr:MoaD/ThiS family protein [Pirellulales bacterium]
MAHVFIPPLMRGQTGGQAELDIEASSLRQLIIALELAHPELVGRLRSGDGLAAGVAASIDGVITSQGLLARLKPESEVHFLPAIGGGC